MKYSLENRTDYIKISIVSFLIGFAISTVSLTGKNYDIFVVSFFGNTDEKITVDKPEKITFYGSKNWRRTYTRSKLDNEYEVVSIKTTLPLGSRVLVRCFNEKMFCLDELKGMNSLEMILSYDRVSNSKLLVFGLFLTVFSLPVFLILKFFTM